ncbi:MAG TPA: hypothetical protein D7I04_05245, partial [Candidatus Poseidoniales archaeon]
MLSAPLSGCFSSSDSNPSEGDLEVGITTLEGGFFQNVELSASSSMSVFIPYLIIENSNDYVQNSTIINLEKGDSHTLSILAPPRTENMIFMIGELGRNFWPIRDQGESWMTWLERGGDRDNSNNGIERVPASGNNTYDTVNHSSKTGGSVIVKLISIDRPMSLSKDEGGVHSTGIVDGRSVYNRLYEMTDPTDSFDIIDGKEGYYDRWAGQGNPAYEDAAQYLISELSSFGLEVIGHRFEFTDITGSQNPEAYNICAYKWGTEVENEWLVFGAHFDVAPPVNGVLLDPHIIGERTYGTRVGAYDNTAGTSMVM